MAEIVGTCKGSLVHRFITAGKPGWCKLCRKHAEKLEAHHLSYSPEITIKLCHACHHTSHFWPNRLRKEDKLHLLSLRFKDNEARRLLEKHEHDVVALAKLFAPSRHSFIHAEQKKEVIAQKHERQHLKLLRSKKEKDSPDLDFLKRIHPKKHPKPL